MPLLRCPLAPARTRLGQGHQEDRGETARPTILGRRGVSDKHDTGVVHVAAAGRLQNRGGQQTL